MYPEHLPHRRHPLFLSKLTLMKDKQLRVFKIKVPMKCAQLETTLISITRC
jgi:hypothetical protein